MPIEDVVAALKYCETDEAQVCRKKTRQQDYKKDLNPAELFVIHNSQVTNTKPAILRIRQAESETWRCGMANISAVNWNSNLPEMGRLGIVDQIGFCALQLTLFGDKQIRTCNQCFV
jgi:hypothetical protein